MTPKQIERINNKIKQIRKALYEEKRMFGGYHDGRGLRYAPLELYLKIQDYKGGLIYLRWFNKNFPDDIGMPDFMFESSLIYFKNQKFVEAEQAIIQTYLTDSILIDIFLDRPINENDKSNIDRDAYFSFFDMLNNQADLTDFKGWLSTFENSSEFKNVKAKTI